MMKDEPITASLPISSGRGTSPGLSPCATAAEPTRQCPVSPADFVRGGAADDGHQMACRTPDNMLFTTFQSQAQNKVLDLVEDLRDAFIARRKSTSTRDTVPGSDLVAWMRDNRNLPKSSANHLVFLLCNLGFIVAIPPAGPGLRHTDSRNVAEKSRYRFQNHDYLPSNVGRNTDFDYAAYLYRVIALSSHHSTLPYEQEALDRLQRKLAIDWRAVQKCAGDRRAILKAMPAEERHSCYLQERKFWRVVRPPPRAACPLRSADHPWNEPNSHEQLLESTEASIATGRSTISNFTLDSSASLMALDRLRSRSMGSREQIARRRRKKQTERDVSSLPTVRPSESQLDHRMQSMVNDKQMRNDMWLRSLQDPYGGLSLRTLDEGNTAPSLAAITGRTDLANMEASANSTPEQQRGSSVGTLWKPIAEATSAPRHSSLTSSVGAGTEREDCLAPHSRGSFSSLLRAPRSASPGNSLTVCAGSVGDGRLSPSAASSDLDEASPIVELSEEEVIQNEIASLEGRLHQPYLSVERIIGVHKKHSTERHELDMLCSGSQSSSQNHWVSSHLDSLPNTDATTNITSHQLRLWSINFDALLHDPRGSLEFDTFLQKEFASENIQFWKEAEVYRNLPTSQLEARAALLYKEFIQQNCSSQINIPATVHLEIRKQIDAGATRFMYDVSQRQVYHLMRKDSYARFLQSQQFKDLQKSVPARSGGGPSNLFRSFRIRRPTGRHSASSTRDMASGHSANTDIKRDKLAQVSKNEVFDLTTRLAFSKQSRKSPESPRATSLSSSTTTRRERDSLQSGTHTLSNPVTTSDSVKSPDSKNLIKHTSAPSSYILRPTSRGSSPVVINGLVQEEYAGKGLSNLVDNLTNPVKSVRSAPVSSAPISTMASSNSIGHAQQAPPPSQLTHTSTNSNNHLLFSLPIESLMTTDCGGRDGDVQAAVASSSAATSTVSAPASTAPVVAGDSSRRVSTTTACSVTSLEAKESHSNTEGRCSSSTSISTSPSARSGASVPRLSIVNANNKDLLLLSGTDLPEEEEEVVNRSTARCSISSAGASTHSSSAACSSVIPQSRSTGNICSKSSGDLSPSNPGRFRRLLPKKPTASNEALSTDEERDPGRERPNSESSMFKFTNRFSSRRSSWGPSRNHSHRGRHSGGESSARSASPFQSLAQRLGLSGGSGGSGTGPSSSASGTPCPTILDRGPQSDESTTDNAAATAAASSSAPAAASAAAPVRSSAAAASETPGVSADQPSAELTNTQPLRRHAMCDDDPSNPEEAQSDSSSSAFRPALRRRTMKHLFG
eukprot:scpid21215/ scgid2133/ Regulator of G-protein signaling 14